jgi:uncharacterized membrane protein
METEMQLEKLAEKFVTPEVLDKYLHSDSANVGDEERKLSLSAALAVGAFALVRHHSLLGRLALLGAAGSLVYRGLTGQCALYKKMGINTREPTEDKAIIVKKAADKNVQNTSTAA